MPLSGMSHYLTSDMKLCHLFNRLLNTVFFHEVFFDSSSLTFDMVSDMYIVSYLRTYYFITCYYSVYDMWLLLHVEYEKYTGGVHKRSPMTLQAYSCSHLIKLFLV